MRKREEIEREASFFLKLRRSFWMDLKRGVQGFLGPSFWGASLFLSFVSFFHLEPLYAQPQQEAGFKAFLKDLWPEAARAGVSLSTFRAAFAHVEPDLKILEKTQKQPEQVKPIGDYIKAALSEKRLAKGKAQLVQWESILSQVESTWGVDRYIVLGIWGMETNFGEVTGGHSVIQALATLAYARYRGNYFRQELIYALKILEEKHISPAQMRGSWAGAMGQTQFMPSSFLRYAVDFDHDNKKNIWTSIPDSLASTAHYLAEHGWIRGWTWGYEVLPSQGFSCEAPDFHPFTFWNSQKWVRGDGIALPTQGEARLLCPAGEEGPLFLVTKNFDVIKKYNNSTSYALGVSLISDLIAGGEGLRRSWP